MIQNNAWQNRIVGSGVKPASNFLFHELNWKIHPRFQQDAIEGSLDQVGWYKSVVESARTGKLLDGHARIILALRRGDDTPVPYEVVDVSESEEALILATLDPLAALADADQEKLDALLRDLPPVDARLQEMLVGLAKGEGLYLDRSSNEMSGNSPWDRVGDANEGVMFSFGAISARIPNEIYERFESACPENGTADFVVQVIENAIGDRR